MTANIYILEDHPVVQMMLCELVNKLPGTKVSGTAVSAEEAIVILPELNIDLLLIDIYLPGINGIDFLKMVRLSHQDLPCLVFSSYNEPMYAQQALAAGAQGYVMKGNPYEFIEGVKQVLAGKMYLSD